MPSLIETIRWFTLIAWMIWFVGYWNGGGRVFWDVRLAYQKPESPRDIWMMLAVVFLSLIIVATGFLVTTGLPLAISGLNKPVITSLGVILTLLGMGGMVYCRRYLDLFLSTDTSSDSGFPLAEHAPYSYVRHPISTGAITMYTGTTLVFPTWWNFTAVLLIIILHMLKTLDEDHFLEQNLPGYADYQQRVPYRLVPRIW